MRPASSTRHTPSGNARGLYLRVRIPDSPAFSAARPERLGFPLGAAMRTAKRGMLIYGGWQMMVSLGGFLLFGYMASYLIRVVGMDPAGAFTAGMVAVLTVAAVGYNISTTVVGSTAPYVSAWLVANCGNPVAPAWYLAVVAVAGLGTALVGLRRTALVGLRRGSVSVSRP